MLILGLVGMYIDAAFVFVTNSLLLFRLALAILCIKSWSGLISYDKYEHMDLRSWILIKNFKDIYVFCLNIKKSLEERIQYTYPSYIYPSLALRAPWQRCVE